MTLSQVIRAVAIHALVPLLGLAAFVLLCVRMKRAGVSAPPYITWFVLFFSIGGWLLVALTALFWEWSGMASLGFFFLVIVAPLLTAASAWKLRRAQSISAFHRVAFFGSVGYSGLMLALVLVWAGLVAGRAHS